VPKKTNKNPDFDVQQQVRAMKSISSPSSQHLEKRVVCLTRIAVLIPAASTLMSVETSVRNNFSNMY